MRASPLVLKDYFMTDFRFSAQPGFDLESQQGTTILPSDVKVDVEELLVPDNSLARSYHITVSLDPAAGDKFPWIFDISLVGFFEISPDWPSDQLDRLFSANAPAILYSAARESLSMISGHGPYQRALLPSITFVPLPDEKSKETDPQQVDEPNATPAV
jgi:preprotein translocase subunit SecB